MCCEDLIDKFPQVDTCCCCCKVETGSKVIAWLGTIGSFLYTVAVILAVVAKHENKEVKSDENSEVIIAVSVVLLIYVVFFWVMALVLLIGLYKDDMGKVKAWLRVNICLFFFGLVGQCLNIITTISTKQPAEEIAQAIISTIISVLMPLYMICVVKSHYYNKTQGFQSGV